MQLMAPEVDETPARWGEKVKSIVTAVVRFPASVENSQE